MITGQNDNLLYSLSINTLDKNISSYNASLKSKLNFAEESHRINHLYLKENLIVGNLEDYRYFSSSSDIQLEQNDDEYISVEEKKKRYNNEEDEIFCGRFPHLKYCGCDSPCSILLNKISPIEVSAQIFAGPIESSYKTKELLKLNITHILNISCTAYNKRKYFKYLDIYLADNHTENAIKFFKITNRFIENAIIKNQKVLVHSVEGKSRCWVFIMAFLIGKHGMKYLTALDFVKQKFHYAEPNENFLTQLKHYDLETNI